MGFGGEGGRQLSSDREPHGRSGQAGFLGQEAKKRAAGTEGVGQLKPMPTGSMAEPAHRSRSSTPPSRGCEDMGTLADRKGQGGPSYPLRPPSLFHFFLSCSTCQAPASSSEALRNLRGSEPVFPSVSWVRGEVREPRGPPQPRFPGCLHTRHVPSPPPAQSDEPMAQGTQTPALQGRGAGGEAGAQVQKWRGARQRPQSGVGGCPGTERVDMTAGEAGEAHCNVGRGLRLVGQRLGQTKERDWEGGSREG